MSYYVTGEDIWALQRVKAELQKHEILIAPNIEESESVIVVHQGNLQKVEGSIQEILKQDKMLNIVDARKNISNELTPIVTFNKKTYVEWWQRAYELQEFCSLKHKMPDRTPSNSKEMKLAEWVNEQRKQRRNLEKIKKDFLEDILQFGWNYQTEISSESIHDAFLERKIITSVPSPLFWEGKKGIVVGSARSGRTTTLIAISQLMKNETFWFNDPTLELRLSSLEKANKEEASLVIYDDIKEIPDFNDNQNVAASCSLEFFIINREKIQEKFNYLVEIDRTQIVGRSI